MNTLIAILAALECLSSAACILSFCFIFYVLTKTRLFHSLFRTTFRIFAVSVVVSMAIELYLVTIGLLESFVMEQSLIDFMTRFIAQQAQAVSVYAYWLAFTSVSAERAFATVLVRSYERRFQSMTAQIKLIATFSCVLFLEVVSSFYYPNATLAFVCGFETSSCVLILYVIRAVSRRHNSAIVSSLSTRFQVKENVLLSTSMFPLMAMCFVWQLALLPLVGIQLNTDDEENRELATALLQFGSSLFLLSYVLGFIRSAAMSKARRSLGLLPPVVNKVQSRMDESEQYAKWMEIQQAAWKIG